MTDKVGVNINQPERLGNPMSNAVSMFLRQVVLQRGIPYEMKLPKTELLNYGSLTREQFDAEMEKGMADVKAGRVMMCCHFCG
jgi:DNA-damage-inducible protein J